MIQVSSWIKEHDLQLVLVKTDIAIHTKRRIPTIGAGVYQSTVAFRRKKAALQASVNIIQMEQKH